MLEFLLLEFILVRRLHIPPRGKGALQHYTASSLEEHDRSAKPCLTSLLINQNQKTNGRTSYITGLNGSAKSIECHFPGFQIGTKGRDPLFKSFGGSYCSLRSWSVIGLCYWLLACQANRCFTTTCLDSPFARFILPFFPIPLFVISAQADLHVSSFRDTSFDVFPLVTIFSLRPSALLFAVSFPSCCGIQLSEGGPRYGFNLSTCTTVVLDRGDF